jgi:WbqC-like protein family
MTSIFSTTYLGPIQYYSELITAENILMERFEHYPKQTYRNRCIIYGANGPQVLSIPVTKGQQLKIYTRDIQIDNSANWTKIHFKAIESAYRCSPFYQFYIDDLIPFYQHKYNFLYDFNLNIINTICKLLDVKIKITGTDQYTKEVTENSIDFREKIHPKLPFGLAFTPPVYRQVFEPKLGFMPNLSIIDLIFNTGPDAKKLLLESTY